MRSRATGTMEPHDRKEGAHADIDGRLRLNTVSGTDLYRGDIEGLSTWHGITVTRADGSGTFVGLQRLDCRLGGRVGSFSVELEGACDMAGAWATWEVVPNSGTGGLANIRGRGSFVYGDGENSYTLNYELD